LAQVASDYYGKYDEAVLYKQIPGNPNNSSLSETVVSPGADHAEVGLGSTTFTKLNDASATTLSDNVGPIGPGDATWAFEWDLTINPFSSTGISKDKYLHWEPVPEPSTAALIAVGLFGARWLRRKLH
jgi:hypothetical protein